MFVSLLYLGGGVFTNKEVARCGGKSFISLTPDSCDLVRIYTRSYPDTVPLTTNALKFWWVYLVIREQVIECFVFILKIKIKKLNIFLSL